MLVFNFKMKQIRDTVLGHLTFKRYYMGCTHYPINVASVFTLSGYC